MVLQITVSDPETHVQGKVSSYVDFKVRTVTDETSRFASGDFFVRRRYRDFLWLRGQLTTAFPGSIVPPLPPVDKLYKGDDRFSTQFIQRRQAGLELFLRRVADHPALTTSTDLKTFLDAKVWELQTEKNKSTPSWYEKMLDTAGDGVKRVTNALTSKTPDDEAVEKLRQFANEYHGVLAAAHAAHHSTVNTLALQAEDMHHLGPAFDLLSQTEKELSGAFNGMAVELDALRELYLKQVQEEHVRGLSSLLAFNAGMAASFKDVLKNRDYSLVQYNKATQLLDKRSKERQAWQDGGGAAERSQGGSPRPGGAGGVMNSMMSKMGLADDPGKGQRLANKVAEAENAVAETKQRWETISEGLESETAKFHRMTNADFAEGLRSHAAQQIAFEQEKQKHWQALLAEFEQVGSYSTQ